MTYFLQAHPVASALISSVLSVALLAISFLAFEPVVGHAATEIFAVHQTITGEISFYASTTVSGSTGAINGLTGGVATNTARAVVLTNNSTGYSMTIQFASATAMYRDGGNGQIPNYAQAGAAADYDFLPSSSAGPGQFGYTVLASTTGEVAQFFKDNGSACGGAGTNETANKCWASPSTTAQTVINSTAATPTSGSTSTIQFKVYVPNSPSPSIPTGTYTATATLTAVTN